MKTLKTIIATCTIMLTSCTKDNNLITINPKILSVEKNYNLSNADVIQVNIAGKNQKNLEQNRFYIDGIEIPSKELFNEVAYSITLPNTTFSEKRMSNVLRFDNGDQSTDFEIFAKGFPIIESISKKISYPNEQIEIEGLNLWYKENVSIIYFMGEKGLVKAKIKEGNKYILKVIIPEEAVSGLIVYETIVNKEEQPRLFICGGLEIRK